LDIGRRNPGSGTLTFPSVEEILKDSRFCRRPRKDCIQHCNWVQSILGLFDVELMNQVLKLDECFERKRHLQLTESTRGDVISLMTSERIVHEPSTKNTNPEPSSDATKSITSNDDLSGSKAKEIDCGDNDDSQKTADSLNDSE
uniref:Zf-CpG_bind_C domain-containing protein n=1 Tax=Anisakis simplex TaxID=6269 RepID=A0A0M3JGH0_ANISI